MTATLDRPRFVPLVDAGHRQGRALLKAAVEVGLFAPLPPGVLVDLHGLLRWGLLAALPEGRECLQFLVGLDEALSITVLFDELPSVLIGPGARMLEALHPRFLPSVIARLEAMPRLPLVFSPLSAYAHGVSWYANEEALERWRAALSQATGKPLQDVRDEDAWRYAEEQDGAITWPSLHRALGVWAEFDFRSLSWSRLNQLARKAHGETGELACSVLRQLAQIGRYHRQIHPCFSPTCCWQRQLGGMTPRQYAFGAYLAEGDLTEEFHQEADEELHNAFRGNATPELELLTKAPEDLPLLRDSLHAYVSAHHAIHTLLRTLGQA